MDPFIGEIRIFAGNFAPVGWFICQGQTLPITSYQALFAVIGTTYGGNGTTNFQLPNLQGRVVLGVGISPVSGKSYSEGSVGGAETVTLTVAQMPSHTHVATFTPGTAGGTLKASAAQANTTSPNGNYLANGTDTTGQNPNYENYVTSAAAGTLSNVAGLTVTGTGTVTNANTGSSTPTPIMPPFLVLNYIIAVEGIFPSRG
jgi:microcystin-dependent protein